MILRKLVLFVLLIGCLGLVSAQEENLPDPVQIYRTIKFTSDERAGDVRWIEIWETQNRAQGDRQWVMIDLQGSEAGIEESCYHAVALGGGAPIFFENGELVPVDNAETLFNEIENRRLVDQSLLYVSGFVENFDSIEVLGEEMVAGIPSERRELVDQDAANLFLIKPPATSVAELWTAIDGSFVTQYTFTADGSSGDVSHTYQLIPGGDIQPPREVNLQCFSEGFPLPEDTEPLVTGNLVHGSFRSEQPIGELQRFYSEVLVPEWEALGNTPTGGRVFSRTLENESICRLGLEFQDNPSGGSVMTVRVIPEFVTEENISNMTDEFVSPVVILNANFSLTIEGTVQEVVDGILPDFESDGWSLRPELTDLREESALLTINKDGLETHIIVDGNGTNANVRIQQRDPVCGPTFDVP